MNEKVSGQIVPWSDRSKSDRSTVKVAYYSFCTMRALIYARAAQATQEHHACAESREPAEEIPRAQK